jgi:tetratricopeptide (TPR) repeat protein
MSPERPPKVFISYSHDSPEHEQRVLNLANRLRSDGFDAAIDQYETSPREGWPVWMEKQIRESDFVLVVCTPPYLGRAERREKEGIGKGAIWETALTLQALYEASANNERFIPIVFSKENLADIPMPLRSATYYLLNNEDGYQRLLRRLRKQPEVEKPALGVSPGVPKFVTESSAASPATARPKALWNVPHARNDAFTGREQLLADLRADLVKKSKQSLFGLGGVGKTQIAVEYAWRHRDEYTAVLWCFAGTEQSVRGGYSAIAALLDLPEKESQEQAKVTDAVKGWLEQNTGWLLVLDNADDPAMVKPFLPQGNTGHLLLTSRAYSFQKIGLVSPREVNVLSPDEAREFLLRRTGKGPSEKSPEADALAKEVGYLPLALEQAAAYIAETGASFKNYLAGFKTQRLKVLERQGPVMGNDEKEQQKRTVATAWALNFADVEKASPASAELLRLSAFLAPDAIPVELLENRATELTERLAAKLAEAADNPLVLDELLSPLLRFSLIRRDEEKRSYRIHPLVQEVLREGLGKEDQKAWAERAVQALNAVFPDVTKFENWPQCDRLLPHALACARLIELWTMEFAEAARLLNQAGYYLNERAEYAQAEPLYRRALAINEKTMGPEHRKTATSLNNLALTLKVQGKYDDAEPLYRRALAIDEKAMGGDHPDTAADLNNLASLLQGQGNYEAAEPLCRRVVAICEKALGPEHPHTAISLNNLATLYRAQGKYVEAEPLYRRALAINEKELGAEHPDTARGLNGLAVLLHDQGKPAEAEPLFWRALAICEKALGLEHPDTLLVRNNLILSYRERGRNAEADALEKGAKGKTK